jgi:hypothetical protein
MKIIVLCQAYNEAPYLRICIECIQPYVDSIIIHEGYRSPHGDCIKKSPDGTRTIAESLSKEFKNVYLIPHKNDQQFNSYEQAEGVVMTSMAHWAEQNGLVDTGDWLWKIDSDEFYSQSSIEDIINLLKTQFCNHTFGTIPEWQFAYCLNLCFKSSHGRFVKYYKNSRFTNGINLVWPNGQKVKGQRNFIIPWRSHMYHLSYAKHPTLIKEKVISFNRPSFTQWYNEVYLEWCFDSNKAYENNSKIAPWYGQGFLEGQDIKIQPRDFHLPDFLKPLDITWIPYIIQNKESLKI